MLCEGLSDNAADAVLETVEEDEIDMDGSFDVDGCESDMAADDVTVGVCDTLKLPRSPVCDSEGLKARVADEVADICHEVVSDAVNEALPVSHSTSPRHPMYPRLRPCTGLQRPPCCGHQ
jgi:hypothetical protein